MNRAIVIKTVGNPEISGAIVDGMKAALPNDAVIEVVQAEIDRQHIQRSLLRVAVGNTKSAEDYACLTVKAQGDYGNLPQHGKVYNAILVVWAALWLFIYWWVEYFQAWNRS